MKRGAKRGPERTTILSLRLKPEEHGRLVAESEAMYLPMSAYIRYRLFGQPAERDRPRGKKR
jgi:hypothetical protein